MVSVNSLYRQHQYVTVVAEDRDGISAAQQRTGAGVLLINGALASGGTYTATDGTNIKVGHQVSVYSAGNLSAVNFTVVGTDPDGYAISETIAGPNNSTVETSNYFYTVTSVSTSATIASDAEVGIVDELATQMVRIEPRASGFDVGMGAHITGTASVTVQQTMTDVNDPTKPRIYVADTTFATKSANFYSRLGVLVTGIRLVTDSYSTGATLEFHVIQNK